MVLEYSVCEFNDAVTGHDTCWQVDIKNGAVIVLRLDATLVYILVGRMPAQRLNNTAFKLRESANHHQSPGEYTVVTRTPPFIGIAE